MASGCSSKAQSRLAPLAGPGGRLGDRHLGFHVSTLRSCLREVQQFVWQIPGLWLLKSQQLKASAEQNPLSPRFVMRRAALEQVL